MVKKALFVVVVLATIGGLPALGVWAGYRLARRGDMARPWERATAVAEQLDYWRQAETLAGGYALAKQSTEGVEKCYYQPHVDFNQVAWVGRDMPAPFVGYAPAPGPIPGGQINSDHFRYSRELAIPKPPGTCRIFVVGGSTAFGAGAGSNETTVAGFLERELNASGQPDGRQFEVVTAAACAWASAQERIVIENWLVDFQPDVVIALSGHNDAFWSAQNRNVNWFRGFQEEYFFTLINAAVSQHQGRTFAAEIARDRQPADAATSTARLVRNARGSARALEAVGAQYAFALQPILSCSNKPRTPRETQAPSLAKEADLIARFADFRRGLAAEQGGNFHYWDLSPIFDQCDGQSEVFLDGCHFGDRGHEQIALALSRLLAPLLHPAVSPATATLPTTRR